jgi:hypothetical protein
MASNIGISRSILKVTPEVGKLKYCNFYRFGRVLGVNKIRRRVRVRVRISIRVQGRVWVRVGVGV